MREVLTTYGRLEKHISTTAKVGEGMVSIREVAGSSSRDRGKELYSTVMWLLLACLLYALLSGWPRWEGVAAIGSRYVDVWSEALGW